MENNLNMKLLQKIHDGANDKFRKDDDVVSHIAILKSWLKEEDPDMLAYVYDVDDERIYDRLYTYENFLKISKEIIQQELEESYFSINSFWTNKKNSNDIRHLNAFVLDFDFYKLEKYKTLTPKQMYEQYILSELPKIPTAVVDSGRGLYVIYAFKHSSYKMTKLYKSIYNRFLKRFKKFGMDPKATNLTQVIRLPGSYNVKAGKSVKILEFNDTEYTIKDFASLLQYTQQEVNDYKKRLKEKANKREPLKGKDSRKPYFEQFVCDLRKLIYLRNNAKVFKGYREYLIYILREWAIWHDYTTEESIQIAMEVNDLFHEPLKKNEVINRCKPSPGRMKSSIETIITKLEINHDECKHLKMLCPRWMKKQRYAKKRQRYKLLNLTKKQYAILERRTRICELKFDKHMKNSQIANTMGIDRSMVTRDLEYIAKNPGKFAKKLSQYMNELEAIRGTEQFTRKLLYETQKQLLDWLNKGYTALDYLVRNLAVAKN